MKDGGESRETPTLNIDDQTTDFMLFFAVWPT